MSIILEFIFIDEFEKEENRTFTVTPVTRSRKGEKNRRLLVFTIAWLAFVAVLF